MNIQRRNFPETNSIDTHAEPLRETCRRELYNIENKYIFFAGKFSISLCPLELSLHYWLFHNPVIIESEKPAAAQTMAGTAVKTEVSGLISFHQSLASGAESQSLRCCSVNLLNNLYQFTVFNDIFHVSKQSCKLKFKRHSFLEIEKNLEAKTNLEGRISFEFKWNFFLKATFSGF